MKAGAEGFAISPRDSFLPCPLGAEERERQKTVLGHQRDASSRQPGAGKVQEWAEETHPLAIPCTGKLELPG